MMGNIHIQPYNPEYILVLHIFGDFKVDKFPFPLIAYLHVDTLHIEKRNKRKRSFCNTRQSIYSIIQVVSCMRAQRWRSNAAPRFSSIYCPAATLACSHAPSNLSSPNPGAWQMSLATSVSMPTRKNDRGIVVLNNGGAWEV